jgi:hypothetical protein
MLRRKESQGGWQERDLMIDESEETLAAIKRANPKTLAELYRDGDQEVQQIIWENCVQHRRGERRRLQSSLLTP